MKNYMMLFCAAGLALCAACAKLPEGENDLVPESRLTVNLEGLPDLQTRATAATEAEKKLTSLNLYVFDANGMLDVSHACTSAEISAKKATLRMKTGKKTVFAAANLAGSVLTAADKVAALSDLEAVTYALSDNVSAFVMYGKGAATVASGTGGSVTVTLRRGVSRVTLASVKNALPAPYGAVKLQRAFLCNVVGNQDLSGGAAPATWLNQEATSDHKKGHVIGKGSYKAQVEALTYVSLAAESLANGSTKKYSPAKPFYAFPNALKTPNNGFNTTFTPTATVLMVVVEIKGVNYYYPVPLKNGIEANTAYQVDLTLSGLGNTEDDPFAKIEKADLTATVSTSDWTTGTGISETI